MTRHFYFTRRVNKRLGEILIELDVIDDELLDKALALRKERNGSIYTGEALLELGYIDEEAIIQAINIQYNFPYIDVDNYHVSLDLIDRIPFKIAHKHQLIPLCRIGNVLTIAMSNPLNIQAIKKIEELCQCCVRAFVAVPSGIRRAIKEYYPEEAKSAERTRGKRRVI